MFLMYLEVKLPFYLLHRLNYQKTHIYILSTIKNTYQHIIDFGFHPINCYLRENRVMWYQTKPSLESKGF